MELECSYKHSLYTWVKIIQQLTSRKFRAWNTRGVGLREVRALVGCTNMWVWWRNRVLMYELDGCDSESLPVAGFRVNSDEISSS
jgi:hypothetical protein